MTLTRLPDSDYAQLEANLKRVRERIAKACEAAGRAPESVSFVAVTKYSDARLCLALLELGVLDLGENRVTDLAAKAEAIDSFKPQLKARWHMIGHLQRNKVKKLPASLYALHSLDSLSLAEELIKRQRLPEQVYVQVNVAEELQKSGLSEAQVENFLRSLPKALSSQICGLMTMAPFDDADAARRTFKGLKGLFDDLQAQGFKGLTRLSMGMSQDFEAAIAEGSNTLRIGRVLYEGLSVFENRA